MKKETLDASLPTIVGAPVIIQHKDITEDNADELRCGVISNARYNEFDGWYYVEGVIWDEKAIELINKGWSVSCSYDFLAFNDEGGIENNIKYDKEFTQLNFTHLAIVDNPRYERANIVFNCKIDNADDQKGKWVTINGTHIFIPDGKTIDEVIDEKWEERTKSYKEAKDHAIKQLELVERKLKEKNTPQKHEELVSDKKELEDRVKYYEEQDKKQKAKKDKSETEGKDEGKGYSLSDKYKNPKHTMKVISLLKEAGISQIKKGFEAHENGERVFITLPQNVLIEHENNLRKIFKKSKDIEDVHFGTPIRGLQNITIKFKKEKTNNSKEQDMAILEELKKFIVKVENEKGEDMDDKEQKDVENEKVDKRKLIDEVGGILKGKVDDEIIRTIIKKMEEMSYDASEDSKADNKKVKNEEDKEEDKKVENEEDKKEDVENKCKNSKADTTSFDKINEIYNSVREVAQKSQEFVSRQEKLDNAVEYFK